MPRSGPYSPYDPLFPPGQRDALLLAAPDGQITVARNHHTPLVPASILQILSALVSLKYLGEDFRYCTEVYVTPQQDLRIKGFGDPLLTSEVMAQWATTRAPSG